MIVRTLVSAALLAGASTFALAQGGGQGGQSGAGATDLQNQCWDQATNQVRNQKPGSMAGGAGGAGAGGAGGAGGSGGTTGAGGGGTAGAGGAGGAGSPTASTRPPGMQNC